ncbi:hypothetical protein N0V85_007759 [Neurospora sp. IMI 360204]|nr:hypothetical protein N0V85_007759 [Neurospora sp. IMI 360204]
MAAQYSIPSESKKLLLEGILANPLIRKNLPAGASEAANKVSFVGSDSPSLPVNWRFAESISALKGYEATILNVLLKEKYGIEPVPVTINTDHAQLFVMSTLLWALDPAGVNLSASSITDPSRRAELEKYFPTWDKHDSVGSWYRADTTNIYKTKDGKFFHLHGSMNPDPTLKSIGLPENMDFTTPEEATAYIQDAVAKYTAEELQTLADGHKQAGTICWTKEEFQASEHGKANADAGLFDLEAVPNPNQRPGWWTSVPRTSPARPLAGLKVVDLTRVIAGPSIARGLAELGASVMRITAPHLPDISVLHPDLNHGKWNACLDLREEADRKKLRDLILGADVFLQGYRPGVLDKYGFGEDDVIKMCEARGRGIVYCGENCYGWRGPWMGRSGWQQISDACCGVSYEFGRAMGNNEPVNPVFPNSDYCTGICGVIGIITALLRQAEHGGSYKVKVALNYYSQWLVNSCGMYPLEVWQDVWQRNGSPVFRHYHSMHYLLPRVLGAVQKSSADRLFKEEFFTQYFVKSLGKTMRIVAPILQFPNQEVKLGFDVGTRTNGVDEARWPQDLSVENVE